jgi:hypothetical protein
MLLFSKTLSDDNMFLINCSLFYTISNSATLTASYIRAILLSINIGKLSHEAIK